MAPAFGLVEAKGLLSYFMDSVTKVSELCWRFVLKLTRARHQMAEIWSGIIENDKSGSSAIIDVNLWFGKATLDAWVMVLVLVCAGCELTVNLSQKDRHWSFRIRLRRLG